MCEDLHSPICLAPSTKVPVQAHTHTNTHCPVPPWWLPKRGWQRWSCRQRGAAAAHCTHLLVELARLAGSLHEKLLGHLPAAGVAGAARGRRGGSPPADTAHRARQWPAHTHRPLGRVPCHCCRSGRALPLLPQRAVACHCPGHAAGMLADAGTAGRGAGWGGECQGQGGAAGEQLPEGPHFWSPA
jgi:hypothetical protein